MRDPVGTLGPVPHGNQGVDRVVQDLRVGSLVLRSRVVGVDGVFHHGVPRWGRWMDLVLQRPMHPMTCPLACDGAYVSVVRATFLAQAQVRKHVVVPYDSCHSLL